MTAILETLPQQLTHPGITAEQVADELLDIVADSIRNQPRTLQKRIGPSEIDTPCPRRLAYKLLDQPERERMVAWKATVGTALHSHLADVFDQYNLIHAAETGWQERFYVETRVSVGEIDGQEVTGSADLFDRVTLTNWDWKLVGPTQLKKYKKNGPGRQYRGQAHLYGRGWQRAGLGCRHVGIVFFARNGEFADTHVWTEPYDEQVAIDALQRLEGIAIATRMVGPQILDQLDAVDDYCNYCPYFHPGSVDLARGCPGAADMTGHTSRPALTLNPSPQPN